MVAGEKGRSLVSGPVYELRAVVAHYGHHNNGHYICYRKHAASGPPPALDKEGGVEVKTEKQEEEVEVEEREAEAESERMEGSEEGSKEGDGEEAATWWRLSDESVRKVPEDVVMAQGNVFMLFYDCVDPTLVRTDEAEGEEGTGEMEAEADTEADTLVGEESADVSARGSEGSVDGEGSSADTLQGSVAGDAKRTDEVPGEDVGAVEGPGTIKGKGKAETACADADAPAAVGGDK